MINNRVLLCILDGFSFGDEGFEFNAYAKAKKRNFPNLLSNGHIMISCSSESVGLPSGQMGNSEVGHLTIGAGRIVNQSLLQITNAINNKSFQKLPAISKIQNSGKNVHIIGLFSDGGVHSSAEHISEIFNFLKDTNNVFIHAITDGRDTAITDSLHCLQKQNSELLLSIATVSGRFYAMDRDNRWDRVFEYYKTIILEDGQSYNGDVCEYIKQCHKNNLYDEFIPPVKLHNFKKIDNNDIIIFANFRPDRMRQIVGAVAYNADNKNIISSPYREIFERNKNHNIYIMTDYFSDKQITAQKLSIDVLFQKENIINTLSEVVSKANMRQFKITESEKYAHITFFLNGEQEMPFPNEERFVVPSKRVSSYDQVPEMGAYEIKDKIIEVINQGDQNLIITNLANCDMVGHTGNFDASKRAVEVVDDVIGQLYSAAVTNKYTMIITADHGNIECMQNEKGQIHTYHTTNLVPFVLLNSKYELIGDVGCSLADIAPTILHILGLNIPKEMTGKLLVKKQIK